MVKVTLNLARDTTRALVVISARLQVGPPVVRIIFFVTAIITGTVHFQPIAAAAVHWKYAWGAAILAAGWWVRGR